MNTWQVVVADDHEMVRTGVRTLLERRLSCDVVGEAANGVEAIGLVRQFHPTVLVTDMVMPGMNGIEVVRQVCALTPRTHVVIFSMYSDEWYVREGLRAGAIGYVLKESLASELVTAVEYAIQGRRYVSSALSERILEAYALPVSREHRDSNQNLSEREREVLVLTAQGLTSGEIATSLAISPRTVESHRANMMRKLSLRTVSDIVRYALRHGLISLDS